MVKPSPPIECHSRCCTGMLFHLPEPAAQRKPRETPLARYTRYTPRTRSLCEDCITEIHRLGVAVAPLPRPVRWRRSAPSGVTHLCEHHKDIRTEQETRD